MRINYSPRTGSWLEVAPTGRTTSSTLISDFTTKTTANSSGKYLYGDLNLEL